MVRLKFEGRKLEDLDFWTKSDPFLTLNRPAKNGAAGLVQVCGIFDMWLTNGVFLRVWNGISPPHVAYY